MVLTREASGRVGSTLFCVYVSFFISFYILVHRGSQWHEICCIMVKKEFLSYEAPEVEIIEVEVEKGFASSGEPGLPEEEM